MDREFQELIERFHTANLRFRKSFDCELLQKMGPSITGPQMYVLHYIKTRERCKLTDIADRVEVKPSAVTVMIDRMERAGFVRRVNDPADRRSILVELTPAGVEILDRVVLYRNEIIGKYFSRLQPEERTLITGLLEKMVFPEKE